MQLFVFIFLSLTSFFSASVGANEVFSDTKIVYLTKNEILFDKNETKISPKNPLPLMSWDSGICFILGSMPEENDKERGVLLEKVFGSFDKNKPFINGTLTDDTGKIYQLSGKIKSETYRRKDPDSTETEMIICNCVACTEKGKAQPDNIRSIQIKAVTPFKAKSVYWYTLKSDALDSLEDTEDPLHRWRKLQEARIQREIKVREEGGEKKSFLQWLFGQ
ncbi:MAG: hypothetical protein ACRBCK_11510 [Alphaproteobacteria bacterium]